MKLHPVRGLAILAVLTAGVALADEWTQFRGRDATGTSNEKNLPVTWSETDNIAWRTKLPGPGTSSPIITGDKIYLTSYSGYGVEQGEGNMSDLVFHVLCLDRKSGNIVWDKTVKPELPEEKYGGYMLRHGYASSTPATDGKYLYVFFGKTGVFCFDLNGNEIWRKSVGTGKHGWGSATSPVLYKDKVIINAAVESGSLVALDKKTGERAWTSKGISSSWNTPVIVNLPDGRTELVVCGSNQVRGYNPDNGDQLWHANSFNWYVCPTVVQHNGVVYAMFTNGSVAVRCGGKGDVTDSHTIWKKKFGSVVSSFVYHKDHLYFCNSGGTVYCIKADTGDEVFRKNLTPNSDIIYASPLLADDKVYFVSQNNGTYVVAANPMFKPLAHNVFKDDNSRTNASPIADNGQILMRTDRYLYCIGKKG